MRPTPRTHFLCCVPVEGAVTALGYFQTSTAVAGALCVLRNIVVTLCHYVRYMPHDYYEEGYRYGYYDIVYIKTMSLVLLTLILCQILGTILVVGVNKRRPGHVLVYLIFGVLGALAGTVYWLVRIFDFYYFVYEGAIEIFLALVVYVVYLVLVYFVYHNIKVEKNTNAIIYNMLQENYHCVNDFREKSLA